MARVNVRVRPAVPDDVPALATLVQSVDTTSGTFSGKALVDASTEHLCGRLATIFDQDDRVLLVATDESGKIVGLLCGRDDEVGAIDLTAVWHVTHLLVAPEARRRGVARALLSAAVQLAEESGADRLLATAAAGSREGNRYLARLGFAPLVMHRIASTATLRRSLGMTDIAGRMVVLRRARQLRAQRGFAARTAGRTV